MDFGEWEGLTRHEIDLRYAGGFTRWAAGERPPPAGVEDDETMAERVLEALADIAAAHPSGRVLVVTSGGPIRAAEAHLRGIDQRSARRIIETVDNCTLVELVWATAPSETPECGAAGWRNTSLSRQQGADRELD